MKKCWTCKKEKPISDFGRNSRRKDGLQGYCRECGKRKDKELYLSSPTRKEKIDQKRRAVYVRNRQFIIEYLLVHPCVDCGESNPLYLDFDHVKGEKLYNVGEMTKQSVGTLIAEIAKCEVRCIKCHRRKTAIEQGWEWAKEFIVPVSHNGSAAES